MAITLSNPLARKMIVRRMLFGHHLIEGEEAFRNKVERPFQSQPGNGRKSYGGGHGTRRTGLSLRTPAIRRLASKKTLTSGRKLDLTTIFA